MSGKMITCTICPVGCEMDIEYEGNKLIKVSGHTCKRGEKYAENEIVDPRRVLTSTVVLNGAKIKLMPVKTDKPIAKDKLLEAVREINKIKIAAPFQIRMGDVLYSDFTENGINLVAGRDVEAVETGTG